MAILRWEQEGWRQEEIGSQEANVQDRRIENFPAAVVIFRVTYALIPGSDPLRKWCIVIGLVVSAATLGVPQPGLAANIPASAQPFYGAGSGMQRHAHTLSSEIRAPQSVLQLNTVDQTVIPNQRQQRWQLGAASVRRSPEASSQATQEWLSERLPFSPHRTCCGRSPPSA